MSCHNFEYFVVFKNVINTTSTTLKVINVPSVMMWYCFLIISFENLSIWVNYKQNIFYKQILNRIMSKEINNHSIQTQFIESLQMGIWIALYLNTIPFQGQHLHCSPSWSPMLSNTDDRGEDCYQWWYSLKSCESYCMNFCAYCPWVALYLHRKYGYVYIPRF